MDAPRPRRLWHYCCGDHAAPGILRDDLIRPHQGGSQQHVSLLAGIPIVTMPVIWLTDLDVTSSEEVELLGLGRNSEYVACSRVEYRFRVPSTAGVWWPSWADQAVEAGTLDPVYRMLLELERAPDRWWVSERPIRSPHLDERYHAPSVAPTGGNS